MSMLRRTFAIRAGILLAVILSASTGVAVAHAAHPGAPPIVVTAAPRPAWCDQFNRAYTNGVQLLEHDATAGILDANDLPDVAAVFSQLESSLRYAPEPAAFAAWSAALTVAVNAHHGNEDGTATSIKAFAARLPALEQLCNPAASTA